MPESVVQIQTPDDVAAHLRGLPRSTGMLHEDEARALHEGALAVPGDQWIVEIGSWKGLSTCWLGWGSKLGNGSPVAAVDVWLRPYTLFRSVRSGRLNRDDLDLNKNTLPDFMHAIEYAGVADVVNPIIGLSTEEAAKWSAGPIGMIFFDASKNYRYIVDDLNAWFPHVVPGAWIGWHDNDDPRMTQFLRDYVRSETIVEGVQDVNRLTYGRVAR